MRNESCAPSPAPLASRSPSWFGGAPSGDPVIARTDATTIRELRRLGGLLKKVHLDSGGAYSNATAQALVAFARAIRSIESGEITK